MEIILQILDATIRKGLGWKEGKNQETYQIAGNTLGDLLKAVKDAEGKSFWELFMEGDAISRTDVSIKGSFFYLYEKELARPLTEGQKVTLLGKWALCGGG